MNVTIPYEPYLFQESRMTNIELWDGTLVDGFYKYNVETESLEQANYDKAYSLNEVKKFTFVADNINSEDSFTNIKLLWPDSEYGGFLKSTKSSEFVQVKFFLEFKPRDYDPRMDVGNPYDRVEMSSEFYIVLNGNWTLIPKEKREFLDDMSKYVDQKTLKKYINKNRFKVDQAEDVGHVINWIAKNKK